VFVDGRIVTPLALVFYELATNSTKNGALNDPDGALGVHISRGIDELRIEWTERAAGATGYFDAADIGFGSKLLDLRINEQLQGSYVRTCTEGGMDIKIILPDKLFSEIPSHPSLTLSRQFYGVRQAERYGAAHFRLRSKMSCELPIGPSARSRSITKRRTDSDLV
jgi:hypothetical protein